MDLLFPPGGERSMLLRTPRMGVDPSDDPRGVRTGAGAGLLLGMSPAVADSGAAGAVAGGTSLR